MRMFEFRRNQHQDASAYADGELRGEQLQRFERHLAGCERCEAAVAETRALKAAVAALPQVAAPRSFAITAEMAASARPARVRAATPLYLTFARAGAALSVAAFATVAAITTLDSSGDEVGSSGKDDSAVPMSAQAPETQVAGYESAGSGAPPEAQPTPMLAPATTDGGASGSGGTDVQPLASVTASVPSTGAQPTSAAASPAPPDSGRSADIPTPGGEAYLDQTTANGLSDTSFSPLPASAEQEYDGPNGALLGLGAVAAAAVVALGVMEVARRRRA